MPILFIVQLLHLVGYALIRNEIQQIGLFNGDALAQYIHSVPAYVLFGWKSMQCATLLCDAEHDICRQRLSHPLLLGPLQIGWQMQFVFVIPIINSILFIVQHDFTLCHCKLTWYDQFRYSKQIVLPELLTNFSFIDV